MKPRDLLPTLTTDKLRKLLAQVRQQSETAFFKHSRNELLAKLYEAPDHELAALPINTQGPTAPTISTEQMEQLKAFITAAVGEESMAYVSDILEAIHSTRKETSRTLVLADPSKPAVDLGPLVHMTFDELLVTLRSGENAMLVGPAGSGKTMAAAQAAKALDVPFHFNGAVDTEYKLNGFIDAQGRVISRPFREAWINGGVYLFDEIDASMPSAVLAFNSALANGRHDFPDGCYPKHKDCYIIAAANTFWGATSEYCGRAKLDEATRDRFSFISWEYDNRLEDAVASSCHSDSELVSDWIACVRRCREAIASNRMKFVLSPRATFGGLNLMRCGASWNQAVERRIRRGLPEDQWRKLQPLIYSESQRRREEAERRKANEEEEARRRALRSNVIVPDDTVSLAELAKRANTPGKKIRGVGKIDLTGLV